MKYFLIALTSLTILSCQSPNNKSESYKVNYNGAFENFMKDSDISTKIDLSEFKNTKNFYALGAVENLKGEIQIFNSEPFITSVEKNSLKFDNTFTKKASLLVYASVEEWESILIPNDIISYKQLENFIEKTADEKGINTDQPFPFLLEGVISSFDWHVINWRDGDTIHTHKKHKSAGMHGTINNRDVEMLGFYSNAHHAIFTHQNTNMHIHVKTAGNGVAGHVDDLFLENGMILKLPKIK
jgi:acetolactate decarboxylase